MEQPLISVIVPVYKVEPYLDKCISSIANQTYTNMEIILVDDGSTDGSSELLDEIAGKIFESKSCIKRTVGSRLQGTKDWSWHMGNTFPLWTAMIP